MMLGPVGPGKPTCLMMLAGFEAAPRGEIEGDDLSISLVPPHRCRIGMVFQNYALCPRPRSMAQMRLTTGCGGRSGRALNQASASHACARM